MKKILLTVALLTSISFVSTQNFSAGGCVVTDVAGVPTCICANTSGQGSISVGMSSCTGAGMGTAGGPLLQLLALAQRIVYLLAPLLIGLAIIVFFWYLIKFIVKGNESPTEKQEGLRGMGYSIIAIFVMVSIWGIVAFIGATLGIGQGGGLPPLEMSRVR